MSDEDTLDPALRAANLALSGRKHREVSRLASIELRFVDAQSGKLIAKHAMSGDLKSLSIRHVTQDKAGLIWFGGQWEGSPSETPQIVGSAGLDRELKLVDAPGGGKDLRGYIGAMAVSNDGRFIAASAPKAGGSRLDEAVEVASAILADHALDGDAPADHALRAALIAGVKVLLGGPGVTGEVVEMGDDEDGQPRVLIHTTREAIKAHGGPLMFRQVRVIPDAPDLGGGK